MCVTSNNLLLTQCIYYSQKGQGAPAREQPFSEEQRKHMMAHAYRKQEEFKVIISFIGNVLINVCEQ